MDYELITLVVIVVAAVLFERRLSGIQAQQERMIRLLDNIARGVSSNPA